MTKQIDLPAGDYVSPGLELVRPDAAYPNMIVGDTALNQWPYLRREIHHNWYVDQRNPTVGFCSRDEAAILYNTARQFVGRPCLEIGCWRGWSTCHLALGSKNLDVIDPVLADEAFLADVKESLGRAGVLDSVTFYTSASPAAVDSISATTGKRWALVFIDGDHEGDAPRADAAAVAQYAADDAVILFHDLAAPSVAAGLAVFRELGWNTMIYQTMQIMGVAWRGAARPVAHVPDPAQQWTLPEHLVSFPISGEDPQDLVYRLLVLLESTSALARPSQAAHPADYNELLSRFDELHAKYIQLQGRVRDLELEQSRVRALPAAPRPPRDACTVSQRSSGTRVSMALLARRLRGLVKPSPPWLRG